MGKPGTSTLLAEHKMHKNSTGLLENAHPSNPLYLICQPSLPPEPKLAWVSLQPRCEQMLMWLAFTLSLLGRFWATPRSLNPHMPFFQLKTM